MIAITPEWCVLPHTSLTLVVSTERDFPPGSFGLLRSVCLRLLECPGMAKLGGMRQGFAIAVESAFTVGLEDKPSPRHLKVLDAIGCGPEITGLVLPGIREVLGKGGRIVCPATPGAIVKLMREGLRFIVTPYQVPADVTATFSPEELALAVPRFPDGVIGAWWKGPWRIEDMAAASLQREQTRAGIQERLARASA